MSRKSHHCIIALLSRLAIACVAMTTLAHASGGDWVQQHYGPADGLPVSSASSAQIDADGFLWVATHDGLARFDGVNFDVHDSMRFPAMSGNRVRSLHTDADGRVFALTEHGDWLTVRSGEIARVPMGEDGPQAVRHVDAASLCLTTAQALHCPDGHGTFPPRLRFPDGESPLMAVAAPANATWLITAAGKAWHHSGTTWQQRGDLPDILTRRLPRPIQVSSDGALWVNGYDSLFRLPATDDGSSAPHEVAPLTVLQLRQDARGRMWVGAMEGLYRFEDEVARPIFVLDDDIPHLSWEAPDGALWVFAGNRLWRFADGEQPLDVHQAPALISAGNVLDLFFDANGAVWVMTLRDGIYRLNRPRVTLLGEAAGLGDGNVYGVTQDSRGSLWLGTLGDGLKGWAKDGSLHHAGRDEGLPGDNPWLVAAAPDDTLFVATYAPGLWQRPTGGSTFSPVLLPDELIGEQTLSISFDAAKRLWLGTTAGAWMHENGAWQKQWPRDAKRKRINALVHADKGEFWLGGAEGVWRQHGGHIHPVAEALLHNTSVRDLYRASDGAVWISTEGRGLIRVASDDPQGTAAIRLGRAQGLPSNSPHAVREDADGHLWVNSNQGIFRLSRANLQDFLANNNVRLSPLVLGLADGLTELEGNGGIQPSALVDHEGTLWFPSQRGVVRIDPRAVALRKHPPHVVIDSVESSGQSHPLTEDMTLPVGMRNILIRYSAADLHAGSELRFRHRLLPLENAWADSANGRSASFSSLPPGSYRFEILAGNSDGIWASTPTHLEFRIPYRWYETPAFRLTLLLAAALMVLAAMRLRVRNLRLRAMELDLQVNQRTAELSTEKDRVEVTLSDLSQAHAELAQTHAQIEERNLQLAEQAQRLETMDRFRTRVLADVSHELRTPVMLVSLPLRELQEKSTALSDIERQRLNLSLTQLDRLGSLVEQLVGLVQAESGQLRSRLRRIDLQLLLGEIVASYQPAAARTHISLTLQADTGSSMLFADRDQLTTVIGNLIDNALKYTPHGGEVRVCLSHTDEHFHIQVQDNGPGFDSALASHLFERFYRIEGPPRQGREGLGIGLALARELVELHGGRILARSTRGVGATFEVELPRGAAHVAIDDLALGDTASSALPSRLAPEPASRGEGRLLLVEDHPDLAAYLAERLAEHLPIICVDSAERALDIVRDDTDIRLIVSDVVLPGRSGLELCRQATSTTHALPVILISAKAADTDRVAGLEAGATAYLAKPFHFDALLTAIASAWPAAAPRLVAPPADPGCVDALLQIALSALGDAEFSIALWAERAHLSERQLRRRVTDLTSQSPQTWLREQRLLRIRHLIRSGECKTLAEAGARCGLDNPAWLYRSYRARFGEH